MTVVHHPGDARIAHRRDPRPPRGRPLGDVRRAFRRLRRLPARRRATARPPARPEPLAARRAAGGTGPGAPGGAEARRRAAARPRAAARGTALARHPGRVGRARGHRRGVESQALAPLVAPSTDRGRGRTHRVASIEKGPPDPGRGGLSRSFPGRASRRAQQHTIAPGGGAQRRGARRLRRDDQPGPRGARDDRPRWPAARFGCGAASRRPCRRRGHPGAGRGSRIGRGRVARLPAQRQRRSACSTARSPGSPCSTTSPTTGTRCPPR